MTTDTYIDKTAKQAVALLAQELGAELRGTIQPLLGPVCDDLASVRDKLNDLEERLDNRRENASLKRLTEQLGEIERVQGGILERLARIEDALSPHQAST